MTDMISEAEKIRLRLEELRGDHTEGIKSPQGPWRWLADHPEDAAELAELLNEAAPTLGLRSYSASKVTPSRAITDISRSWQNAQASSLLKERIQAAVPIPSGAGKVEWSKLTGFITSEMYVAELLARQEDHHFVGDQVAEEANTPKAKAASNHRSYLAPPTTPGGSLIEVNSGGRVFFCLFDMEETLTTDSQLPFLGQNGACPSPKTGHREGCLVLKFAPSRMLCQSEQFANELARYCGICSPDTRILRTSAVDDEWAELHIAAERLSGTHRELLDELNNSNVVLVMEYIPGKSLFSTPVAFQSTSALGTFSDLGRLFALDMLLGNSDRLRCEALGWRGNPENVMCAKAGRWEGRLVAIDAVVQRRPPGGLLSAEDAACEKMLELTLNDKNVAEGILREAVGSSAAAIAALDVNPAAAVDAFQAGLRRGLDATMGLKGLLEMMFEVVTEWISEFIDDIEGLVTPPAPPSTARRAGSAGSIPSSSSASASANGAFLTQAQSAATTFRIRQINQEATHNRSVSEKVSEWKNVFRGRGEDLRAAVEEWQVKRESKVEEAGSSGDEDFHSPLNSPINSPINSRNSTPKKKEQPNPSSADYDNDDALLAAVASPRSAATASGVKLTTGFLDGTANPVVDVYELKVRLEHMLQRLRVLQQASATAQPTCLLPGVYLSGAVEASSLHLLRYYGITHVLNCTEDLLLPEETHSFVGMRIPLRDLEEEDIKSYFGPAAGFIDKALASGGGVLVHCHAGRSRSCSLVLAWLITRRKWTLKQALEFLQEKRPQAAPNAGYLQQLAALEAELFGTQTVKVKKTKPEPKCCPECGIKIGLSAESVRVHLRLKHPAKAHEYLASNGSGLKSSISGNSDVVL